MPAVHVSSGPGACNEERRLHTRYKIALELTYLILSGSRRGELGKARTIDVSSVGVRFAAERPLAPGLSVELAVDWPTLLDGRVPLQLIADGSVLRVDGYDAVVKVERHVFKTRKAAPRRHP